MGNHINNVPISSPRQFLRNRFSLPIAPGKIAPASTTTCPQPLTTAVADAILNLPSHSLFIIHRRLRHLAFLSPRSVSIPWSKPWQQLAIYTHAYCFKSVLLSHRATFWSNRFILILVLFQNQSRLFAVFSLRFLLGLLSECVCVTLLMLVITEGDVNVIKWFPEWKVLIVQRVHFRHIWRRREQKSDSYRHGLLRTSLLP